MNLKLKHNKGAYALLSVLVMAAVGVVLYASIYQSTQTTALLNDRNIMFNKSIVAAEAASETTLSYILRDFLNQSYDPAMMSAYGDYIPTGDWAKEFRFSDGAGSDNCSHVEGSMSMVTTNLESQFKGLYGLVYDCRIRSQATPLSKSYDMTATVQQDLQLASIPIFQFAIFYAMDLEINPGAAMNITGKVHGNSDLYVAPSASLSFQDDVAATGKIFFNRHPDDPTGGSKTTPSFAEPYLENVTALTLPVATNNAPEAVRGILAVPPFGEDPDSPEGKHRYYNTCDLIITTTASGVTVQSGKWNGFSLLTPDVNPGKPTASFSFLNTTNTFWDSREGKYTVLTELDVTKLKAWIAAGGASLNTLAVSAIGHQLNSVYIRDTRSVSGKLTAVRVTEGKTLPDAGLTVATELPLYVKGHFNAPNTTVGSTDTSSTKPASLVGDALTILSGSWNDANSKTMNTASHTTVNAAILAGIVPSCTYYGVKHYSGGVENFPRFLENWSGKSITYNGSMVVMFPSQYATSFWKAPGTYYQAPTRRWAFDLNFLDYRKLPPATPQVRTVIRSHWNVVANN